MSVLVVPDFTSQLKIEGKIMDLRDLQMILNVQEPMCKCCIPRKFRDPDEYNQTMDKFEQELINEMRAMDNEIDALAVRQS